MIGGFIIKEDAEVCLNENELTPEIEISPVVETEANASSENCDKYCQYLKILALKIAELEDKIVNLEIKLNSPVEKQKKRKKKVKCKGKKIEKSKCRRKVKIKN